MAIPFIDDTSQVQANDTLQNLVANVGTTRDKRVYDRMVFIERTRAELDAAFRGDWLSRKIVSIPASDMTRAWRTHKAEKTEIELIEAEEKRLGVQRKLHEALLLSRLHGGAALILGYGDEDPSRPAPQTIGKGGLKYLLAVTRYEIAANEIIRDVTSPFHGQPVSYQVSSGSGTIVNIHPSRVIAFQGNARPDRDVATEFWGDSVLQAAYDAVHDAALSTSSIAALLHEAKIDVVKIERLTENLQTQAYADKLARRFGLAAQLKSIQNVLLLDSAEEWSQKQLSFQNLPETMREFLNIVAGAADIPVTRLLGQSPGGLNSTGESDIRNYYDRISGDQNVWLTPALSLLDDALWMSATGTRPTGAWYEWVSLWQQTPKEKAETAKIKAEATEKYQKSGLVPADALAKGVQNQLIEDGVYPGLEEAIEESEIELNFEPVDPETDPDAEEEPGAAPIQQQDAAPRTLYVRRNVKNAADIVKWAKSQGFETTLPAEDMHVTIAFSRTPIDWMKTGETWADELQIAAGGARIVEPLGPKGAVVLLFNSSELSWRHRSIIRAGASWDWPDYQPHITITYEAKGMDLSKVEPYRGEIVLGPEIFSEVKDDWQPAEA